MKKHKMASAEKRYIRTCTLLVVVQLSFAVAQVQPRPRRRDRRKNAESSMCSLYLADKGYGYRLFAGIDFVPGQSVGSPDLMFPMFDVDKTHASAWHEYDVRINHPIDHRFNFESRFYSSMLVGGIPNFVYCAISADHGAVKPSSRYEYSETPRENPLVGSRTPFRNFGYEALNEICAGQEIHLSCPDEFYQFNISASPSCQGETDSKLDDQEWLRANGICLDRLEVATSPRDGVEFEIYSRNSVEEGETIATSPVLLLDRSQVNIAEQVYSLNHKLPWTRDHRIEYSSKSRAKQLVLNYCYGHPKSNVLLLPLAPGFTSMKHNSTPNAVLRWSADESNSWWLQSSSYAVLKEPCRNDLFVELVALRDISPADEISIDFGEAWTYAWEQHVANFQPEDTDYVSSARYQEHHRGDAIRTHAEQLSSPYPRNVETACYFPSRHLADGERVVDWNQGPKTKECPRRCTLASRGSENGLLSYSALITPFENKVDFHQCGHLPEEGLLVDRVPHDYITLADKPYTSDSHLAGAFHHEIGAPPGFFPETWMAIQQTTSDFSDDDLIPGEMQPIRWKGSGEPVSDWGFRLGLHKDIRTKLLEFANDSGATDILRHVTIEGNPLDSGVEIDISLGGEDWYLQRPPKQWSSNLHWISPASDTSQFSFLRALQAGGFDGMLDGIGRKLDAEGLVAFQLTFMAMTFGEEPNFHIDMSNSGGKAYNVIIPLIIANETEPELGLISSLDESLSGKLKYEEDVAVMIGDDLYHASANADYRSNGGFRMAATVYIADVNEKNVDSIVAHFTQKYPPAKRDALLTIAGDHWKRDGTARMPI